MFKRFFVSLLLRIVIERFFAQIDILDRVIGGIFCNAISGFLEQKYLDTTVSSTAFKVSCLTESRFVSLV